jgi:hypothetical protein
MRELPLAGRLAGGLGALTASLALLILLRHLVLSKIEQVSSHLRRAARDPDHVDRIGWLRPDTLDLREIATLYGAVNDGLAELDLRNRSRALVKATAERLRHAEERTFLQNACAVLRDEDGGLGEARAFIARQADGEARWLLEARSDVDESSSGQRDGRGLLPGGGRPASPGGHDILARASLTEMQTEAVIQFLRSGQGLEWQGNALFLRTHLTSQGDVSLVTVVTPGEGPRLAPLPFAHLCTLWASEVARAWHQLRFQDLAASLELSQQLQRKWIQSDSGDTGASAALGERIGFESLPSRFINGDFLCVFRLERRDASIIVLGDVTGHELRAGLAATGCVAALSDRFDASRNDPPHQLLEAFVQSLNRYVWASYRGALGLRALCVHFDHGTGQGALACFGQPFPYVLSSSERKPMVIVPAVNPGMLGLAAEIDGTPTTFQLLSGQVFFACTEGILATEDVHGRRFEKLIQRGALADILQRDPLASAPEMLASFIDAARVHAGDTSLRNDLTAVTFKAGWNSAEGSRPASSKRS